MNFQVTFKTHASEGTLALAAALGGRLEAGDVLALSGDLGAGKTTFVRGLAQGMGIVDSVSSPTYILMHAYEGTGLPLYHYDAWMEGRQKALLAEGGAGVLETDGVVVVEWAARVLEQLPPGHLRMELRHLDLEARELDCSGNTAHWGNVLRALVDEFRLDPSRFPGVEIPAEESTQGAAKSTPSPPDEPDPMGFPG